MRRSADILLVDDEVRILEVYQALLGDEGFSVAVAAQSDEALGKISVHAYDVVILDQFLGPARGLDLMPLMREMQPGTAFIIMTANGSTDLAVDALKQGASDFIVKPFQLRDLVRSINYVIKKRDLDRERQNLLSGLERAVNEKTEELKRVYTHVLSSLAHAMEQRDRGTYGHSRRVSYNSRLIAAALELSEAERADLKTAALLHDIGKIGITDFILAKEGPLSEAEQDIVRQHPQKGVEILRPLKQYERILPGILHHHERFDGTGYPGGLAGEAIPLFARIIAIADTYDAIISTRPYRKGNSHAYALAELCHFAGTQFDPHIVQAFAEADGRYQLMKKHEVSLTPSPLSDVVGS